MSKKFTTQTQEEILETLYYDNSGLCDQLKYVWNTLSDSEKRNFWSDVKYESNYNFANWLEKTIYLAQDMFEKMRISEFKDSLLFENEMVRCHPEFFKLLISDNPVLNLAQLINYFKNNDIVNVLIDNGYIEPINDINYDSKMNGIRYHKFGNDIIYKHKTDNENLYYKLNLKLIKV